MTGGLIERVAVALAMTNGGDFYDPNFYTEDQRNVWRTKARDAIAAMREPTDEMVEGASVYADYSAVYRAWEDMIDTALR